jgi:hypothetical protein
MSGQTSRALVRAAERRLAQDSRSMAYLASLKHEANRAGLRISDAARDEVWQQLAWTDDRLEEWRRQGRLTAQLENRVSDELAYFLEHIGYCSEHGYQAIVKALAQAPALTIGGRIETMVDACYLLVDEL